MMELSTHLPNERHSEPRPIHTVLSMRAFSPNQQGTSCILWNSVEPRNAMNQGPRYEVPWIQEPSGPKDTITLIAEPGGPSAPAAGLWLIT